MFKLIEDHYRENFNRLTKVVLRRLGGKHFLAEEAVNTAYLRAVQYFHGFDPAIKPFEGWFTTILNNTVRQVRAEELNGGIVKDEEFLKDVAVEGLHDPYSSDLTKKVAKEVESIGNDTHKEVCRLYFQCNFDAKSIFDVSEGVSLASIHQIISRFRHNFVEKYGVDGSLFVDAT